MRWDGDVEDVDEDWTSQGERVVSDDSFDSLRVSLTELLRWRGKVLLPKFCLEGVALRPESHLLIFF